MEETRVRQTPEAWWSFQTWAKSSVFIVTPQVAAPQGTAPLDPGVKFSKGKYPCDQLLWMKVEPWDVRNGG